MLVSRYHPFFWLLNSQLILSSFTKSAIRSLSPCLVKKTSILFETPPNIFLLLKNYRFPLIPEVKEDSDDLVMYTRVSLLIFFVLIEFGFLLAALF